MKKGVKTLIPIMSIALTLSCGKLDVVGKDSVRAFGEMLQKAGASRLHSAGKAADAYYTITAPDSGASFCWHSAAGSPNVTFDVMMTFNAAPFVDAGLDIAKLPPSITFNSFVNGELVICSKLTPAPADKPETESAPTALAAYERIVNFYRNAIGYHAELDHYGISLGNGNMFEWAKNLATNDKDIVFVLNPEPFINAGVDVTKIKGWTFAKVTVDDENGKPIKVDKILKPFDLK
jgi:hypothetical protein